MAKVNIIYSNTGGRANPQFKSGIGIFDEYIYTDEIGSYSGEIILNASVYNMRFYNLWQSANQTLFTYATAISVADVSITRTNVNQPIIAGQIVQGNGLFKRALVDCVAGDFYSNKFIDVYNTRNIFNNGFNSLKFLNKPDPAGGLPLKVFQSVLQLPDVEPPISIQGKVFDYSDGTWIKRRTNKAGTPFILFQGARGGAGSYVLVQYLYTRFDSNMNVLQRFITLPDINNIYRLMLTAHKDNYYVYLNDDLNPPEYIDTATGDIYKRSSIYIQVNTGAQQDYVEIDSIKQGKFIEFKGAAGSVKADITNDNIVTFNQGTLTNISGKFKKTYNMQLTTEDWKTIKGIENYLNGNIFVNINNDCDEGDFENAFRKVGICNINYNINKSSAINISLTESDIDTKEQQLTPWQTDYQQRYV